GTTWNRRQLPQPLLKNGADESRADLLSYKQRGQSPSSFVFPTAPSSHTVQHSPLSQFPAAFSLRWCLRRREGDLIVHRWLQSPLRTCRPELPRRRVQKN